MKEYIQVPISCYTWCSFQVFTSVVHPEILTTTWSALATSTDSWWKAQNRISKQRKLSNTNDTTAPVVSITTSRSYSYQDQQLSTRVLELSVYHYRMKLFHLIVAVTLLVSGRTQLQGFDLQSVSLICNKKLFLRHSDRVSCLKTIRIRDFYCTGNVLHLWGFGVYSPRNSENWRPWNVI